MGKFVNLPNLLTLARIVLTPVIVLEIRGGRHVEALIVFFLAAFTDLLDGAAARRFGIATPAGAYLDPIADKCLLSGVFPGAGGRGIVPGGSSRSSSGATSSSWAESGIVMLFTSVRALPAQRLGQGLDLRSDCDRGRLDGARCFPTFRYWMRLRP